MQNPTKLIPSVSYDQKFDFESPKNFSKDSKLKAFARSRPK